VVVVVVVVVGVVVGEGSFLFIYGYGADWLCLVCSILFFCVVWALRAWRFWRCCVGVLF